MITVSEARSWVKAFVASVNGCKGVELASRYAELTVVAGGEYPPLCSVLDQLVLDGELIEVEFVLPHLSHAAKSFYLPAGSEVAVIEPAKT